MNYLSRWKACAALLFKKSPESVVTSQIIKSADSEVLIEWLMESARRIRGFNLTCDYADRYKLKLNVFSGHTFRDIILYGSYQMDLMELIVSHVNPQNLLFIDVGANIGTTILNAHSLGFRKFLGFEPIKKNFDDLLQNTKQISQDSELDCRMLAVGNKKGRIPLHLNEASCGKHSFKVDFDYKTEVVEVVTLDDLSIDQENFMLIDTEGFELEVLLGAKGLIPKIQGVCAEVTPRYISEKDLDELRVFLNTHFKRHFIKGRLIERDITYAEFYNNSEQYDVVSFK